MPDSTELDREALKARLRKVLAGGCGFCCGPPIGGKRPDASCDPDVSDGESGSEPSDETTSHDG